MNTKQVRIRAHDLKLLRKECRELFLQSHPEMMDEAMTDAFLMNKVIVFYLEA